MSQQSAELLVGEDKVQSQTKAPDTRIIKQRYRNFILLARFWKGEYRGRLWGHKTLLIDEVGQDLETLVTSLKQQADDLIAARYRARSEAPPSDEEYSQALESVRQQLTEQQLAMLRAHANSPARQANLANLQVAAGYAAATDAMLGYAEASRLLADELGYEPQLDATTLRTASLKLFLTTPKHGQGDSDRWTMHENIAKIIAQW